MSGTNGVFTDEPLDAVILTSSAVIWKPMPPSMQDRITPFLSVMLEQRNSNSYVAPFGVASTANGL